MKKRSLKQLALHKKSISNLSLKGGLPAEEASEGSEHALNSLDPVKCSPESLIPNTDCTCA